MIKCPLCGFNFDEVSAKSACSGCGKTGCGLVKCPNCSYEFPPEKKENKSGFWQRFKKSKKED